MTYMEKGSFKMYCEKCEKEFTRKTAFNDNTIEEYKNIYGTRCPYCHFLIKPEE